MSTSPSTNDVEVQTILNVRPFVLDYPQVAKVVVNKTANTEIVIKPIDETKQFYSLLQYTPYQDIKQGCMRVLNLPKETKLSFRKNSLPQKFQKLKRLAMELTLCDDDGVCEAGSEILRRYEEHLEPGPSREDTSAQSNILVMPHILNKDAIAKVYQLK